MFPPRPPTIRSQPSFFATCLDTIRQRSGDDYHVHWAAIVAALPSSTAIQSIFTSLFSSLKPIPLDGSPNTRMLVKAEANLLKTIFGDLDDPELWDSVSAVALGREWDEGSARILVCWASNSESGKSSDTKPTLELLLSRALEVWTSADHIKHSLLSRHHCKWPEYSHSSFLKSQILHVLCLLLCRICHSPRQPAPLRFPPLSSTASAYISSIWILTSEDVEC